MLNDCTLTASNTQTNGNAQFLDAVILYQSMSGDAADGTSTFSMTGGQLVNTSGHLFHVTNTPAVISLNGVTIDDSGDGADTFLYTAATGTDTIGDYESGDLLQILDANGDETTFSKATFSGTKLTLNVTGGGKVIFGNVDSSTTFNINGTSYGISGKTLSTATT